MLKESNTENATLRLIEPHGTPPSQHLSSENQLFMTEDEYPVKDTSFQDYVNVLDEFPDEHFDFIAVDGRARKSCLLKSLSKLKKGGFLLLDNSERKRYQSAIDQVNGWPKIYTTTGLTDTTIWMKP